jgi:hypothetical protein
MGEPVSCASLRSVRPGFKLSMGKSTDFLQCFEGIHIIFLTAVNDTNASFIQNQNSLIQSFQRLITIAQLTSRGPVRKSLGELMVGNVIGVWLKSRQCERSSAQRRPPIPEKEVRRSLR